MSRFLWKLILNGLVLVPLMYWFTNATIFGIIIAVFVLSAVSYMIGDQFILRKTNNLITTIADAGMAYLYLWIVGSTFNWGFTAGELLIPVIALAIVEVVYHVILKRGEEENNEQAIEDRLFPVQRRKVATQEFSTELGSTVEKNKEEEDPNIYRWDD